MSNLGFELWWAGGTTTLLTTQPQVGSPANMLNRRLGTISFTYLGPPISDGALSAFEWTPLSSKVEKRVDSWMKNFMSSVTRLTLTNACLSSLPMHAMGVCLLGNGIYIHQLFNKHRSRFY
jgi:hypothetical protein